MLEVQVTPVNDLTQPGAGVNDKAVISIALMILQAAGLGLVNIQLLFQIIKRKFQQREEKVQHIEVFDPDGFLNWSKWRRRLVPLPVAGQLILELRWKTSKN